ncbi:LamG-like jellyroll fold domain-containing protein [uncultured Algibacter sp.]|uniref:LamG-like jellyroll fold domain-containing protein n=1 Tax=uncultured Algibacter sp. TaxID=298659 RepID=UPI0026135C32|nr:LamG-like jellyroll fold domain-containing protein [uncultured Algibacter sp.]
MKHFATNIFILLSLLFCSTKIYGQLHSKPNCGQNFNLNWTTNSASDDYYWPPGKLTNTYTNVDGSETDVTITFTGETETLGFWSGNTPKVGTQSSYLYKGIDLLSNGFSGTGITCTITFSKPIYALSFDIHHINKWETNGDKYTFTGKDKDGNTIYPEFTHSPSPSYNSDTNTGIVNAISNLTSSNNAIIGVNFSNSNYIKSVSFLWEDCDTCDHYLPHATGIGNFSFCAPQIIDFDGQDDYINSDAFLGGRTEVTMMSWIKLDEGSDGGEIMGQRNFRLFVDSSKRLNAFLKTNTESEIKSPDLSEYILNENIWHHVALKFNSNEGSVILYLDGKAIWNYSDNALVGTTIDGTTIWNLNHDFEIGRNSQFDNDYFEGSIYESRVFNKALNENQLHQQINQEIENNNGNIRGTVIPKNIEGLFWDDLLLYYNMKNANTGFVSDISNNNRNGILNNMLISQESQDYTAPLPYETTNSCDGNWTNSNNWLHGRVWNINTKIPEHSIIKINGNLEVGMDILTTGLIVNKDGILKVNQNVALINSWYLLLDGIIDLEGKSQLVQTENSTLDKISSGILEKNLQGTADNFTYNYWSSPVGKINNSTINNCYTVKDIFPNVNFLTAGYDGIISPLSISDYWIWKYSNKLTDNYSSWQHVRSSGEIIPGEGFTMKGPGAKSITEVQEYRLQGKPNNGDISLPVYAGNDYLIGNPYPSAIDAVKFIQDNKSTISGQGSTDGTLYFWNHWGGGSHIATDYQGGYASYSLSGGVPAVGKNNDTKNTATGNYQEDIPNRYIPVGQGFYTTTETNGSINFNNSQRVFYIEDTQTNVAHKNGSKTNNVVNGNDSRMKLRIGFNSVNTLQRQLLITVDKNATSGYDWGYDSKYIDTQVDDMYWLIGNNKYIIQGINEINHETIIPLGIHTKTDGYNSIKIDDLKNVQSDLEIYLYDKELNIYHDLRQSKYETYLEVGEYLNRFEITFSKNNTLDTQENENKKIEVYFSNEKNDIVINNPASKQIEYVEMFNILGQTLFRFNSNTNQKRIKYNAKQIKTGNYILKIETEFGMISKKVLIN